MAHPRADTAAQQGAAKIIISGSDLQRVVDRIAHQILEKTSGATGTVLLGIPTRGVPLARRLAARIHAFEGIDVPVGSLDITLYRDDLRLHATRALGKTEIPGGGLDGRRVILVDDVLFSGRTVRAALDALGDVGLAQLRAARRARRPRPPGAADPRRLRRQEHSDRADRERARLALRDRRGR
nr:hypothetical protein GCM10020092_029560 [Actinoplanes digitatis]